MALCEVLLFAKYKTFNYFVETKKCESYYIELYIQHMSFTVPDMPLIVSDSMLISWHMKPKSSFDDKG